MIKKIRIKKCCYCGKYLLSTENALHSLYTLWTIPENIWCASKTTRAFLFLLEWKFSSGNKFYLVCTDICCSRKQAGLSPSHPIISRRWHHGGIVAWPKPPAQSGMDFRFDPSPVNHQAPSTSTHPGWPNHSFPGQDDICVRNTEENILFYCFLSFS